MNSNFLSSKKIYHVSCQKSFFTYIHKPKGELKTSYALYESLHEYVLILWSKFSDIEAKTKDLNSCEDHFCDSTTLATVYQVTSVFAIFRELKSLATAEIFKKL